MGWVRGRIVSDSDSSLNLDDGRIVVLKFSYDIINYINLAKCLKQASSWC